MKETKGGFRALDRHHIVPTPFIAYLNFTIDSSRVDTSVISELGHSLSHVYNQNTSVRHDWILALTYDIHSRSHQTASNMKLMVGFWSSTSCLSQLVRFFTTLCIRETVVTQCLFHGMFGLAHDRKNALRHFSFCQTCCARFDTLLTFLFLPSVFSQT